MKSFNIGDLKIPVPIVQGGMGIGISLPGLASAVSNMGGNRHTEAIRKEIRKAREQSNGVIGGNIMTVITNFSDMVRISIEEGIDIIFSGAGLPLDLPGYLTKGSRTKLVPIVSSARAASIISNNWKQNFDYLPDAFVVEGPDQKKI